MSNKFNIGDKVILTGSHLIPTYDWPVWGSHHECVGVIVDKDQGLIWVEWSNGYTRCIKHQNLTLYAGQKKQPVSPNIAFIKYKKEQYEKRKRGKR